MKNGHRFARTLLIALSMFAPGLVAATTWSCWYNLDQQVACLLRDAPAASALAPREIHAFEAARPIDRPPTTGPVAHPYVVQLLRTRPGAFRGRTVYIPLHTEPFDHRGVAALAQAVMCGAQPACRAAYGERPAATIEMAADFSDANDPLLMALES